MASSISVSEMRRLEEEEFAKGTSVLELMERAGRECAKLIESKLGPGARVIVFCGPGNNGGDGLVCARYLREKNDVTVVMPVEPKTDAAKANYERAKAEGVKFGSVEETRCTPAEIVIDALLGIGAKGSLRGSIKEICVMINSRKGFKVSIDVPTGMDADSGECDPDAVRPDATICIHAPKSGEEKAGEGKTGELWLADIGMRAPAN